MQHITEHPEWKHRKVTLICGPPASGKSTLARQLHTNVLELEMISAPTYPLRLKLYGRMAYRIGRNPMPDHAVVRGAASSTERDHHAGLCHPSRTIVLLTPAEVCHQRIAERGRAEAAGEHEAVDAWWVAWNMEHFGTTRQW
jgi:hypothetical protein